MKRVASGVGVTLWTRGDMDAALDPPTEALIDECRPAIVTVHCGPDRMLRSAAKLIARVRVLIPSVRMHMGVGCDFWIGKAITEGGSNAAIRTAIDEIKMATRLGHNLGVECVTFDAEAACKLNSLVTHKISTMLFAECRAEFPDMILGHTAYDHPTFHGDDVDGIYNDGHVRGEYDWRGWTGDGGADVEEWQNYVAPKTGFSSKGALAARIRSSDASVTIAVRKGWVREEIQTARYVQLHHTPFAEITSASTLATVVKGWCAPRVPVGRMDESGAWALRGICAMQRAGIRVPGGIELFQQTHGLQVDGRAGRDTLAKLGIVVPVGVV